MHQTKPGGVIMQIYADKVRKKHPDHLNRWPLLTGYDVLSGRLGAFTVSIFRATGVHVAVNAEGVGDLGFLVTGNQLEGGTIEDLRKLVELHFQVGPRDAVIFENGGIFDSEFDAMMRKHEQAMGLGQMKIFLSHKGENKSLVRRFKESLALLGFDPWIDEDAMPAGTNLERGLLKGFNQSCAVVFFITPQFVDENYLETEVNHAMREKRKKGDRFQIITLLFEGAGDKNVPELLQSDVYKRPADQIDALKEILVALPIKVGPIQWK